MSQERVDRLRGFLEACGYVVWPIVIAAVLWHLAHAIGVVT